MVAVTLQEDAKSQSDYIFEQWRSCALYDNYDDFSIRKMTYRMRLLKNYDLRKVSEQ